MALKPPLTLSDFLRNIRERHPAKSVNNSKHSYIFSSSQLDIISYSFDLYNNSFDLYSAQICEPTNFVLLQINNKNNGIQTFRNSELRVPVLSFGIATFGGANKFFKSWGNTQAKEPTRMVNLCLDLGITMFDTTDCYSEGLSEEILGNTLKDKRNKVMTSSKGTFPMDEKMNGLGSSRYQLIEAYENSLRRLQTDYIDVYYICIDLMLPLR